MQLTRQADYAIRAILYLATEAHANIKDIAKAQFVPQEYLAKIVQKLADAGLIETRRGVGGGITLARPPEEISLLDVIEAVDGPLRLNRCFIRPGECPRESICSVHDELLEIQEELAERLAGTDFASIAQKESSRSS